MFGTAELFAALSIPVVALLLGYVGGATIHTTIAYVTIKREARRSRTEYMRLVETELLPPVRAQIKDDTKTQVDNLARELQAQAQARIENAANSAAALTQQLQDQAEATATDLGTALESFRQDLGNSVERIESRLEALGTTDRVGPALEEFLRSEPGKQWAVELAGVVAADFEEWFREKTTSTAGAVARHAQSQIERLLDANFSFGNPIVDGLWASIDKDTKRGVYARIAKMFRRAGFVLVPTETPGTVADELQDADAPLALEGQVELPASWNR